MKKLLLRWGSICALAFGSTLSLNAQYCASNFTSVTYEFLTNVTFAGINNTSTGTLGGPVNYTAQTATVVAGNSYNLSVTMDPDANDYIYAWIDWNQNSILNDAGETYVVASLSSIAGPHTISIPVPAGATPGTTRLRVMVDYNNAAPNPCRNATWGEAEDYSVNVIVIPTPPTPVQDLATPTCVSGSTLDVSGAPGTDEQWYWQTTPSGTSMTDLYAGPFSIFANGTYYLRTFNTALSLWSPQSSSVVVTNFPTAVTPPAPVATTNPACITTGTDLTMVAPPMGTEYYWQGTSEFATDMTNNASTPYPATTTDTYYVRAFDAATSCWSDASGVLVTLSTLVPPAPTAIPDHIFDCTGVPSAIMLNASAAVPASTVITFAAPYTLPSGTSASLNQTISLPAGAVITSTSLAFNNVTIGGGSWPSDIDISMSGVSSLGVQDLAPITGGVTNAGPYTSSPVISGNGMATLTMNHTYGPGGPANFGSIELTINYTVPAVIEWYDAATAGNLVATGSPVNAVGTTVLPDANTSGDYDFFAISYVNGCYSTSTTQVIVSLAPVNVELLPVAVTCNNGNDGTFTLGTVTCGGAPFTYAVDGGTFGAIPTNLTVGDHDIIVQDNFGQQSGIYTISVGDAAAPSGLMVNDFTYDIVDLAWTAGGSETQWNVEWGMPGFTPGTGTEEGSGTATGTSTYTITGLDGFTTYDIYVSANCGGGTTAGDWIMISQTTLCDPMKAQGFCESFDSDSETQDCWTVINNNGDFDAWNMNGTLNAYTGDQGAQMYTDGNGGNNDDWLVMPLMTLTNNEILSFYYRSWSAFEPTDFEIRLSTTGMDVADFTEVVLPLAAYSNTTYADTTIDLAAYSGDCYIAFHVPAGGLDGWYLLIDQVCIDICIPDPGIDGTHDVCSEDGTLNLMPVITPGEFNGVWEFLPNPGVVSGTDLNLNLMPNEGTFVMEYIVTTACTTDTTLATVTIYPPSAAGVSGSLDDLCTNWTSINVMDGLSGNIDLGGTWSNNSGEGTLTGSQWTPAETTTAGAYTFDYSVSNGVCPASVSTVTVNLMSCLGMDDNDGAFLSVYPNPVSDVLTIQNMSLTSGVLDVMDIQGKLVYSIQLNEVYGNYQLDMNDIQSGIYVVRITSENGVKESRVVKH